MKYLLIFIFLVTIYFIYILIIKKHISKLIIINNLKNGRISQKEIDYLIAVTKESLNNFLYFPNYPELQSNFLSYREMLVRFQTTGGLLKKHIKLLIELSRILDNSSIYSFLSETESKLKMQSNPYSNYPKHDAWKSDQDSILLIIAER